MGSPDISVVIPVRNEGGRLPATLRSIASTRSKPFPLEVVLVDDASGDGSCTNLVRLAEQFRSPNLTVRIIRFSERIGVPAARTAGGLAALGDLIFMTDAHVRFVEGWDQVIARHAGDSRILAGTVLDPTSRFAGTGCRLIVPFMGTKWVRASGDEPFPVHVAACAATVVPRRLFAQLGGFDPGMRIYGGAEPEFSVRAWLAGAEIVGIPELHVAHRFKPVEERERFVGEHRPVMIHNCLRFGMLYLDPPAVLQMLRHFSMEFPDRVAEAFRLIRSSDVWERRDFLRRTLPRDFGWFIRRFDLKDQVGGDILTIGARTPLPSGA